MTRYSYVFICRDNPFRDQYITVYGVESYEIAKKRAIEKINSEWWAPEVKMRQIAELDNENNTEEKTRMPNGMAVLLGCK